MSVTSYQVNRGTGGEVSFVGDTEDEVRAAAEKAVTEIDFMRSPSIVFGPRATNGRWVAVVRYYGLD